MRKYRYYDSSENDWAQSLSLFQLLKHIFSKINREMCVNLSDSNDIDVDWILFKSWKEMRRYDVDKERKIADVLGQTSRANVVGNFSVTNTIRRLNEKRPLLRLHRWMLICRFTERAFSFSSLVRTSLFRLRLLSFSLRLVRHVVICALYLARWPPAQPMKARGSELLRRSYGMAGVCGRLGLPPLQRSYCFSHPKPPRQPPQARNRLPLPRLRSTPLTVPLQLEFTSSSFSLACPLPLLLTPANGCARPPPTALCLEF